MAFGWSGELIRLVPLEKGKHLENALEWLNDDAITKWTLIGDTPIARLYEEEYFDKISRGSESDVGFAIELLSGEHIGFSGVHNIDYKHGVATTGTIIGRKDLWRKGYGRDAARVRADYAFETLGLRLLLTEVFVENVASLGMLKSVGYQEYGTIEKRYWRRGALRDVVLLRLDKE